MGSRSQDRAENAVKKLQTECPDSKNTVEIVQVDLASDDSIEEAFRKVSTSPGRIDALINNAGKWPMILVMPDPHGLQAPPSTWSSSLARFRFATAS